MNRIYHITIILIFSTSLFAGNHNNNSSVKQETFHERIAKKLHGTWEAQNTKLLIVLTLNKNSTFTYHNKSSGSEKLFGTYRIAVNSKIQIKFNIKNNKKLPDGVFYKKIITIGDFEFTKSNLSSNLKRKF